MVKVEVYGDPRSTCTQRILILLEELDLKYNVNNVDLMKGDQHSEEFLKLQPFGKIPVLEYDDRVLFESRSILRYIAKNNNDVKDLYGGTDVDIWLEVESQNYNPPASKIVYEKVFKTWKGEKPDSKMIESSVEELERVLDVYEKRLGEHPFIAGAEFSIADISHIPYTNYLLKCGYKDLYKRRPNVYKWLKRIIKRDSVQYLLKGKDDIEIENEKEDLILEKDIDEKSKHKLETVELDNFKETSGVKKRERRKQ